jgi:biotin carboxyl carrier protein
MSLPVRVPSVRFRALLVLSAAALAAGADPSPPGALEAFRKLTPAERGRLLDKVPQLERYLATARRGTVSAAVVERGTVEPADVADVVCRVKNRGKADAAATTIRWVIDDGTSVKKGDKLVELDDSALQEDLRAQKAAHAQAVAARAEAEEQLGLVRRENEVEVRLAEVQVKLAEVELKKYSGTDADLRQILELKVEQARLLRERARVRARAREAPAELELRSRTAAAQREAARLAETEEQVRECVLLAPRDGLVIYAVPEQARAGRGTPLPVVAQGEPVREGQRLLRVCDLGRMLVTVRVHEAWVSRVRPGQRALVAVDAFPGRQIPGEVKQMAAVASQADWFSADVKVYPVVVALAGQTPGLRPGMTAEARIVLEERADVLRVPVQAVLGRGGQRYCLVKTGEGVVERRVVIGLTDDLGAEVREGLAEGDVVLRDPGLLLALPALRAGGAEAPPDGQGAAARPAAEVLVRSVRPAAEEGGTRRTRVESYGLTPKDFESLKAIPGVAGLVPLRYFPQEVRRLERVHNGWVVATTAGFAGRAGLALQAGRFLTEADDAELKNVAVLGAAAAARLFPGEEPVGQTVRAGAHFYSVVGVLRESAAEAGGLRAADLDGGVFLPLATCRARFGERIVIRQAGSLRAEVVPLSAILVSVEQPGQVAAVAEQVRAQLRAAHAQKDWEVETRSGG